MTASGDGVHERWMRLALDEARRGLEAGEVPIGAVVVFEERAIASAFNRPIGLHDPSGHAEMLAIRAAASAIGNYRLAGTTVYVTLEPCLMCAGALVHARVGTLVYGADEPRTGCIVSNVRALDLPHHNHRVDVIPGVLADECRDLIQDFFRSRRAPDSPRR